MIGIAMNSPFSRLVFKFLKTNLSSSTQSIRSSISTNSCVVCRICQSESGIMVHPCACTGTMGNVHNRCLNDWVNVSNKSACEICREKYSMSNMCFRPVWNWSKPKLSWRNIVEVLTILGLWYSFIYILLLIPESKIWQRVYHDNLSIREDDIGRFLLALMVTVVLIGVHTLLFTRTFNYVKRQREIKYIDSKLYDSHLSNMEANTI